MVSDWISTWPRTSPPATPCVLATAGHLSRWRKRLFVATWRSAASPIASSTSPPATPAHQYPLLLHGPYFELCRKQVVKQADLVVALYARGDAFTVDEAA